MGEEVEEGEAREGEEESEVREDLNQQEENLSFLVNDYAMEVVVEKEVDKSGELGMKKMEGNVEEEEKWIEALAMREEWGTWYYVGGGRGLEGCVEGNLKGGVNDWIFDGEVESLRVGVGWNGEGGNSWDSREYLEGCWVVAVGSGCVVCDRVAFRGLCLRHNQAG